MFQWADDLKLRDADLYLDSRRPRTNCFISHAHSDHIAVHPQHHRHPNNRRPPTPTPRPPKRPRTPPRRHPQFQPRHPTQNPPAGHIFGSAMLHVRRPEGTSSTPAISNSAPASPSPPPSPNKPTSWSWNALYGQPLLPLPSMAKSRRRANPKSPRCHHLAAATTQPIVMGYALGKALQEAIRLLTDAGIPVTLHGAVFIIAELYQKMGVPLGPFRRYRYEDFHGPTALDLHQRGVLIAPPNVARSAFTTKFKNPYRVMLSGWALLKNAKYRYGVDEVLPLRPRRLRRAALELIDRVHPKKIFTPPRPSKNSAST